MTVLPAINVEEGDDAGLLARLDAVRNVADRVHLDVCDGTMTPNRTWRDAARWTEFSGGLGLQAHLMVDDPEAIIGDWLDAGATEIVVHIEPLMSAQEEGGAAVVERLRGLRMTCLERDAALIIAGSYLIPARPLLAAKAYSDALLVLGVLLTVISILSTYVKREALDPDQFKKTSQELIASPAIQQQIANR